MNDPKELPPQPPAASQATSQTTEAGIKDLGTRFASALNEGVKLKNRPLSDLEPGHPDLQ